MRLFIFCCVLLLTIANISADWSWGGDDNKKDESNDKSTELLQGEEMSDAQENNFNTNGTVLDGIVDELVSRSQGRSLSGFDDVYSDPNIKEALDAGDDTEARNLIKSRLCTLGLIQVIIRNTNLLKYFNICMLYSITRKYFIYISKLLFLF